MKLDYNPISNPLFEFDAIGYSGTPTGYVLYSGGAGSAMPAHSIEASDTPFHADRAFSAAHYFNGTIHSDLQTSQIVDIPSEYWGDTGLKARFIYWANNGDARISNSAYVVALDANENSLGSLSASKVSTDGVVGAWYPVVFDVIVSNSAARKVRFSARQTAVANAGTFSVAGSIAGLFVGWDQDAQTGCERFMAYQADTAAKLRAEGLMDSLRADRYMDARGNLAPILPTKEIVCWGDSLTGGAYPAYLLTHFNGLRTISNFGIGGETSSEVLARVKGHDVDTSGITWTPGTIRLKTRRAVPAREISEDYRAYWAAYGVEIAEPYKVEFFNANGLIGSTRTQLKATATVSGNRLTATHPFSNGDEVYHLGSLPSGMYAGKVYFVRDSDVSGYSLSEFTGGAAISFGSGTVTTLGGFYFDWNYNGENHDITAISHADKDCSNAVIWCGMNNIYETEQVKADIAAAFGHIKTLAKRTLILTCLGNSAATIGTADYNSRMDINGWILREYPDNSFDIDVYLRSMYDPNIQQDVIDHDNGITPGSLRVDAIHLNATGYAYVADKVFEFFSERNW